MGGNALIDCVVEITSGKDLEKLSAAAMDQIIPEAKTIHRSCIHVITNVGLHSLSQAEAGGVDVALKEAQLSESA